MTDDAADLARGRALASPLRMRILRFCLHEGHSNREIAHEFDLNPGTSLHHVRALVDTGFLAAEQPRPGKRGATEIPYRATGASWRTEMPNQGPILVQTFLDDIQGLDPDDLGVWRLGFKVNEATERELSDRITNLLVEFKDRGPDADGRPLSIMVALHPEVRKSP
jgi:DNA-binding transcriptional ArsR family regulator